MTDLVDRLALALRQARSGSGRGRHAAPTKIPASQQVVWRRMAEELIERMQANGLQVTLALPEQPSKAHGHEE